MHIVFLSSCVTEPGLCFKLSNTSNYEI